MGEEKQINGLVEGKPSVPSGSKRLERVRRKVKSEEFKEFLAAKGEELGLPKGGWTYVMEKWKTPEGRVTKRHYWWHKETDKAFYHLRRSDEQETA